jgi:intein/homing endonuclease
MKLSEQLHSEIENGRNGRAGIIPVPYDRVGDYIDIAKNTSYVIGGETGCFTGEQLVHTEQGVMPISEIKVGDKVLSYNLKTKINEYKTVTNTITHKTHVDKLFRIKMKDGTVINVTENHEFFTGEKFVKIKDLLLSLQHEAMEKDTGLQ